MTDFNDIRKIIQKKVNTYDIYHIGSLNNLFNNVEFDERSVSAYCAGENYPSFASVDALLPNNIIIKVYFRFFPTQFLDNNYQYLESSNYEISFLYDNQFYTLFGIHNDFKPKCMLNISKISQEPLYLCLDKIPFVKENYKVLCFPDYDQNSNIITETIKKIDDSHTRK